MYAYELTVSALPSDKEAAISIIEEQGVTIDETITTYDMDNENPRVEIAFYARPEQWASAKEDLTRAGIEYDVIHEAQVPREDVEWLWREE